MSVLVSRSRLLIAVFSCALLGGLGWIWVSHLTAAGSGVTSAPASQPATQRFSSSRWQLQNPNLNANTKSVAEAVSTGKHAERLSPLFMPADFDKAVFNANPQAYLDVIEPGRVWQTADYGPNVPTLTPKGNWMLDVTPGGKVDLVVTGAPLAPVTFDAMDGGAFDNQLYSMTVRADANGVARVTFTATPGTVGTIKILAGSPLASGQVEFGVTVQSNP